MTTQLLVIKAPDFHWAVHADAVRRVMLESDWAGPTPFDVLGQFNASRRPELGPTRVVLLQARTRQVALCARSPIELQSFSTDQLAALPDLAPSAARRLIEAIVLIEDAPRPLFLLATDELERVAA